MIDQVMASVRTLPMLLPAVILGLIVAGVTTAVLRQGRRPAWATGLFAGWWVVMLTLGLDPAGGVRAHACDLSHWVPLPPIRWLETSSDALNIWIFVPLGLLALLASPRRRWWLLGSGALLPIVIECAQLLLPRDCTSFDLVNNWTGLLGGALVGFVLVLVSARLRRG